VAFELVLGFGCGVDGRSAVMQSASGGTAGKAASPPSQWRRAPRRRPPPLGDHRPRCWMRADAL